MKKPRCDEFGQIHAQQGCDNKHHPNANEICTNDLVVKRETAERILLTGIRHCLPQKPIIRHWDRGPDDKGALFGAASGLIEVLQNPRGRELVPPQGAWAYFEVDDVDNQYHRVLAKGLRVKRELATWPWGHRGFSVIDPNGLELVVFSTTS